jgi:hypothetical protein
MKCSLTKCKRLSFFQYRMILGKSKIKEPCRYELQGPFDYRMRYYLTLYYRYRPFPFLAGILFHFIITPLILRGIRVETGLPVLIIWP